MSSRRALAHRPNPGFLSGLTGQISLTDIALVGAAIVFWPKISGIIDSLLPQIRPEQGSAGGAGSSYQGSDAQFVSSWMNQNITAIPILGSPNLSASWTVRHIGLADDLVVGADFGYVGSDQAIATIQADLHAGDDAAWRNYTVSASAPYQGTRPAVLWAHSFIRNQQGRELVRQNEFWGIVAELV